jgi:hypothetical protein
MPTIIGAFCFGVATGLALVMVLIRYVPFQPETLSLNPEERDRVIRWADTLRAERDANRATVPGFYAGFDAGADNGSRVWPIDPETGRRLDDIAEANGQAERC